MIAYIFLMKVLIRFLNLKSLKPKCQIPQNGNGDLLKRGRRELGCFTPKKMLVWWPFFECTLWSVVNYSQSLDIDLEFWVSGWSNIIRYSQIIRIDMKLANEDVSMLAFTSEQITAPFLLPEMVLSLCAHRACFLCVFTTFSSLIYHIWLSCLPIFAYRLKGWPACLIIFSCNLLVLSEDLLVWKTLKSMNSVRKSCLSRYVKIRF